MIDKKTILITGCSSGIGFDAVFALQKRGHRVIASCRSSDDLAKLLDLKAEAVLLDLNDSSSITAAFGQVMAMTSGRLDVLINNAGFGQAGALEDISRDAIRQQFETNVFGLLELTNLAIPVMRQQGSGRIINVSSVLGLISMPFRGAYNASKYALEGLSDTLRLELNSTGIRVITIEPGPIESRFSDNLMKHSLANLAVDTSYFKRQYERMISSYQQVKTNSIFTAKTSAVINRLIHGVEAKKPKIKYPVTFPTYLFIFLKRLLPTCWLDKIILSISRKELS